MLNEISKDIINSKKSGNKDRANALILLKSELLNNQKVEKPKDELQIVTAYAKKLEKSLELYSGESLAKLEIEVSIIKEFMPKELSEEEIRKGIEKLLSENPEI